MQVYGADKVWHQMNREGTKVARCTVERLMKRNASHCCRLGRDFQALAQGQIFTLDVGLCLLSVPLLSGFLFKSSRSSWASCKA